MAGTKKHGRNKNKCKAYKDKGQREKNKERKLKKILKRLKDPSRYKIEDNQIRRIK